MTASPSDASNSNDSTQICEDENLRSSHGKRRRRVHRATWVFLFGVFAVWAFLALPGKRYIHYGPNGVEVSFYQHGWPTVHSETATHRILNVVRTTPAQAAEAATDVVQSQKTKEKGNDGRELMVFAYQTGNGDRSQWADQEFDQGPYWLKWRNWKLTGDSFRILWWGLALLVNSANA